MGFFKKDEVQEKEVQIVIEPKIETKEIEKNSVKKKDISLFDVHTIEYVIENFPSMSTEIQEGLKNLASILEDTIDHIEDKSSEIIKKNREFKISKAHRDISIAIYDVVQNIDEYVNWMQDEYEKNSKKEKNISHQANEVVQNDIKEKDLEGQKEQLDNSIEGQEEIEIYKDFSLKEPKGFKLDSNIVTVDDWDDLLVKTAEVLTKQYKNNKHSNKVVSNIKPIQKKSNQNSFRDTVIEMLTEYKINLDEFKIIIK
jgi:ElaB/YqjD/DUF883 family membrane-anchored ribosome-binding protein